MARHRGSKRNRRSRNANARRRRVAELGGSAGAFVAFGLGALAGALAANADFGFDNLIDRLDPGTVATAAGPDVVEPGGMSALLSAFTNPSGVDALLGAHISLLPDPGAGGSSAASLRDPIHSVEQAWITGALGGSGGSGGPGGAGGIGGLGGAAGAGGQVGLNLSPHFPLSAGFVATRGPGRACPHGW